MFIPINKQNYFQELLLIYVSYLRSIIILNLLLIFMKLVLCDFRFFICNKYEILLNDDSSLTGGFTEVFQTFKSRRSDHEQCLFLSELFLPELIYIIYSIKRSLSYATFDSEFLIILSRIQHISVLFKRQMIL